MNMDSATCTSYPCVFMSTPCRVGVDIHVGCCFTDVCVGILVRVSVTPITKGIPAQIFFGRHVFLFPRALPFVFCYDLDLCYQGQAMRAFFIRLGFSLILSKEGY